MAGGLSERLRGGGRRDRRGSRATTASCSAAVFRLDARGEVEDQWYTPVNPQRDPGPTWIHGLTAEALADAPLFGEIAEEFAARLADRVLVAHNALFDWSMIAREYARNSREAPVRQRLCTIALSKQLALPLPNYKLESLAAHYGVVQQRAHHALDDARVLAEAFRPSLHLAARQEVRLPLLACQPLSEWSDAVVPRSPGGAAGAGYRSAGSGYGGTWRPSRKRPACPYPNPGRYEPDGRLVQGMRVAISGDTSVDRELLEDRAIAAGLHIASTSPASPASWSPTIRIPPRPRSPRPAPSAPRHRRGRLQPAPPGRGPRAGGLRACGVPSVDVYRFLLSRQWVILTLLGLALIPR